MNQELKKKRDKLAETYSRATRKMLDYQAMDDFKTGYDAALTAVVELLGEFDESAVKKRFSLGNNPFVCVPDKSELYEPNCLEHARWQHEEMMKKLGSWE